MIKQNQPQSEYRAAEGISNSELLMVQNNPASLIWSRNAPVDASKSGTKDLGSAIHAAILEPQNFEDIILVADVKGRQTQTFQKLADDNPDKIVVTEEEATKVRLIRESAMAHPTFAQFINLDSDFEVSVYGEIDGVKVKSRPDIRPKRLPIIGDLKSTASLDDWRSTREWINPLYKFNYGHQAAFYLMVEESLGRVMESFSFLVVQTSISMGRYPVSVFTVTKSELIEWGFWDAAATNLRVYKNCRDNNNWAHHELFYFGDGITISEAE